MASEEASNNSILPKDDPSRKPKSNDPGWKYAFWPDKNKRDLVECALCGKQVTSGIKRLKQHLAGNYADCTMCPKTTTEIRKEMAAALLKNQRNKVPLVFDDDEEEVQEQDLHSSMGDTNLSKAPSSGTLSKQKKKTSMLNYLQPQPAQGKSVVQMLRKSPEDVVKDRHDKSINQTTIDFS